MSKKKITKNVFWMSIVSLLNDISSEMIFPILPLFLSSVLGAPASVIGLIEGVAESAASILKTFSGYISDKLKKRKSLAVFGYSFSTISKFLFPLAQTWPVILIARIGDRIGKGIRDSPRDALLASSSKKRGRSFGFHRMMDTSGAFIGVLLASILLWRFSDGFRTIFWIAIVPGLAAVFIIQLFVKEKKVKKKKPFKFKFGHLNINYKKFIFISAFFNLANFSYAFFILMAKELNFTIALIPILYLVYNFIYAFASYPAGTFADKIGKKKMIFLGYIVFALTLLAFAFNETKYLLWLFFGLYGLYMAFVNANSKAFISDLVPNKERATALGVYYTLIGLAVFPASFIAGLLWDSIAPYATFIYGAIIASIAAFLLLILVKEK